MIANARCSTIWMMTLTFQWLSCEVDYGSFVCTEFYRSGFSLEIIGESLPWHLHHYVEHTSLLKVMLAHMQMPVGWPVACGGEGHVLGKLFTFKLAKWKPSRQRHHFPSLLNWVHGDAEITFKSHGDVTEGGGFSQESSCFGYDEWGLGSSRVVCAVHLCAYFWKLAPFY